MNMNFETTFKYTRSSGTATTLCMVQVNEAEVWVAWSDGMITSHTSLGLDYSLTQPYYFDNQVIALPETFVISPSTSLTILSMTKMGDYVYVMFKMSSGTFAIAPVNIQTHHGDTPIAVPFDSSTLNSNLVAVNNALAVASQLTDSLDRNILYVYTLSNSTWHQLPIESKPQVEMRHIVDGLNGNIFITAKNSHGIVELNTTTTTQQLHKINRHPYKLGVNQNKDVWVISDLNNGNNLLTLYNQSSATGVPFCSFDGNNTVLDDLRTQRLWGVGATTTRVDKASLDGVTAGVAAHEACLTNQYTYDKYDPSTDTVTSTTVRPYLVLRTDSNVYMYRATALTAVNSSEILVTAMIATGAQGYYGG